MVGLVLPNCGCITAALLAMAEIRSHEGNRHVYETSMIDDWWGSWTKNAGN